MSEPAIKRWVGQLTPLAISPTFEQPASVRVYDSFFHAQFETSGVLKIAIGGRKTAGRGNSPDGSTSHREPVFGFEGRLEMRVLN